jgi:uncharacterized repeat protein (TIGR03803 family)
LLAAAGLLSFCGSAFGQSSATFETYDSFSKPSFRDHDDFYYLSPRLLEGPDGSLYGATQMGGLKSCHRPYGCGTVFRITPDGRRTILHTFTGTDGAFPLDSPTHLRRGNFPALAFGPDGSLYGVTLEGGPAWSASNAGAGTVFRIDSDGTFTLLHAFTGGADGANPAEGLVQAADGTLYGTTLGGGLAACLGQYCGTIFRIGTNGVFSTRHRFSFADGYMPVGGLAAAPDGSVYGLTRLGGSGPCLTVLGDREGCGTVFRIAPGGTVSSVYSFAGSPGRSLPVVGDLTVDPVDGTLIGTMWDRCPQSMELCRAVFRLSQTGTLTKSVFATNHGEPVFSLTIDAAGHLFALSWLICDDTSHPWKWCGSVYGLADDGTQTTLYDFTDGPERGRPFSLVHGARQELFGIAAGDSTCWNGDASCGLVFRIGLFDSAATPNLKLQSFRSPGRAPAGAVVTLTDTVANTGASPAEPSNTAFWASKTDSLHGAELLGAHAVGMLPAGGKTKADTTVTLPAAPGEYTLIARADDGRALHEAYEIDNTTRRRVVVGPDLVIRRLVPQGGQGIEVSPASPSSTSPTTISVYTANRGGDQAAPSVTRLFLSNSTTLDGAILIGEFQVDVLLPGEQDHRSVVTTLPPGTYFLLAQTDVSDQVAEASEHNLFRLRVTVQGPTN